jgi:hypothetical protein
MTTRAQTIIQDYRLDPKCMRRFAEAMNRGCLVLPSSSGLYSQIPRAWEAYCLEMDLPVILVEGAENHGEACARLHVYTSPFRFCKPASEVGVCHSLLEGLTPWEETCQRAMDRFGFDHPRPGCDPTGVTFHNKHWTSFDNFPSAAVDALAMFLKLRVHEHRARMLEEEKQTRRDVQR